jgi:hypothetical protein
MRMAEIADDAQQQIADHIVQRTLETWERKKEPYLLSQISTELSPKGLNYKSVLGAGTTLKQFVSTLPGVRVVIHPIQKAKVGLVPADSGFSFEIEPGVGAGGGLDDRPRRARVPSRKYVVMQFLDALSKLPEEELKSVNIPVHILAKLIED